MNVKTSSELIIKNLGGKGNISNFLHCSTRLRFTIKDSQKVNKKALENVEGVISVVEVSSQLQIVIGNNVKNYYDEISKQIDWKADSQNQSANTNKNQNLLGRLIDTVSGIFTPFIYTLAGVGILKGVLSLLTTMNIIQANSGAHFLLTIVSDGMFKFLPLFIAYTAAQQFKTNRFTAVALAAALVHPDVAAVMAEGIKLELFNIPIVLVDYLGSVFPIIFGVFLLSYVERFFEKVLHENIRNVLTPALSLIVLVPITMLLVGPLVNTGSLKLSDFLQWLFEVNPLIAGIFLGGVCQVMVMFGLHWAIFPIVMFNISQYGFDTLSVPMALSVFAQAGSAFGVFLLTKNKKMKQMSLSAAITSILGITEPAIYGVNLKLRKPFLYALIAAAVGGGIMSAGGGRTTAFALGSLLSLPTYVGEGFTFVIIGVLVNFFLAAGLTVVFKFDDIENTEEVNESNSETIIDSPVSGDIVELSEVKDPVFSEGHMGKGVAVIPNDGTVKAPIDGTISTLFPTLHAIGITGKNGVEILIHVGIDTVNLDGEHFEVFVKQGDQVKRGQEILHFDKAALLDKNYDITIPVLVTNADEYEEVSILNNGSINSLEQLIALK